MIRNRANGRVYVGQSRDPARRFASHSRNPPHRMRTDAEKYQPFRSFFEFTVLQEGLDKVEANKMEAAYIELHDATSEKGYNWCFGKPFGCRRWWARLRKKL
jgi:predicted GIY-YIG superfamily endonuclease